MIVIAKKNLIDQLAKDKEYPLISESDEFYRLENDLGIFREYCKWRFEELPEVGELCFFSDDEISWYINEFNGKGAFNNMFYTKGIGSFKYFKRVKF